MLSGIVNCNDSYIYSCIFYESIQFLLPICLIATVFNWLFLGT